MMTLAVWVAGNLYDIRQVMGDTITMDLTRTNVVSSGPAKFTCYAWSKNWQLNKLKGKFVIV